MPIHQPYHHNIQVTGPVGRRWSNLTSDNFSRAQHTSYLHHQNISLTPEIPQLPSIPKILDCYYYSCRRRLWMRRHVPHELVLGSPWFRTTVAYKYKRRRRRWWSSARRLLWTGVTRQPGVFDDKHYFYASVRNNCS